MNTIKAFLFTTILSGIVQQQGFSQVYPTFGPEKKVTITGLTFDAMEPFISIDGNCLFFNSLNSGGNTNLYYATKVNDSLFNFIGLVNGCYYNSPNHLDAVASADNADNFFWVSMRGYPATIENLHRGIYSSGSVTDTTRVYGDFNIYVLGWIIMDAFISQQGDQLIYCNAYFDFINNSCGGMPCESSMGLAEKVNDSIFNKHANTEALFDSINDPDYLTYAPQLTEDGLELYFTRLLKATINTEICVSVRTNTGEPFSQPIVLHSNLGFVPEAPTLTTDKQIMYYHQKNTSGVDEIFMRYRNGTTELMPLANTPEFQLIYDENNSTLNIHSSVTTDKCKVEITNIAGQTLIKKSGQETIQLSEFPKGIYIVTVRFNHKKYTTRLIR